MTKKETDCRKYKSRYFYNSLCSRICEISLYFSNLNTHCCIVLVIVARIGTATFPRPPGRPGFTQNSSACPLDEDLNLAKMDAGSQQIVKNKLYVDGVLILLSGFPLLIYPVHSL